MLIVNDFSDTIVDTFNKIECIELFKNGKSEKFNPDSPQFEELIKKLNEVFSCGHLAPAFGVSLHDLTVKEMQNGDWIKLHYSEELEKNGLPFTALLFKKENVYGTNLIREYNGKYDGRCIYMDFNKETDLEMLK